MSFIRCIHRFLLCFAGVVTHFQYLCHRLLFFLAPGWRAAAVGVAGAKQDGGGDGRGQAVWSAAGARRASPVMDGWSLYIPDTVSDKGFA